MRRRVVVPHPSDRPGRRPRGRRSRRRRPRRRPSRTVRVGWRGRRARSERATRPAPACVLSPAPRAARQVARLLYTWENLVFSCLRRHEDDTVLSADLEGTAAEGLGVRRNVVENLALKTLFYLGEAPIDELAEHLRIAPYIVEGVFQRLKKDQLMLATGLAGSGHRVALTS